MSTLLSGFLFTLVVYILYKGYKVKADNPLKLSDIPKFNRDQLLTIAAIVVMVVCCIGFKLDTGLFAFATAAVLVLLGVVDEKKAIKGIPWGTLVFICGVGVLINVIDTLGGITLVSDFLTGFMIEKTAVPILAATRESCPGSVLQRGLLCRLYIQLRQRCAKSLEAASITWN